jgi:hypothetical protein
LLDYRCQREDPGIYHGSLRDNGEIGYAIADAYECLFRLLYPVRIWPQCKVEQCEDDQAGEQAPSQRWEIYAGHGTGCFVRAVLRADGHYVQKCSLAGVVWKDAALVLRRKAGLAVVASRSACMR